MGLRPRARFARGWSSAINHNRTSSSGGGAGLYVKSDRNFHLLDDLRIDTIENVWIETQDLIIGVIYKPPSLSNRDFLDKLEENLRTIYLSKKKCLIMGDDHINTLKQSNISKEYLNLLRS